jgi:hypothetical protein
MKAAVRKKCIVMNCSNHTDEGEFVGDLCSPCHKFVTSGRGVHSQAYRNSRQIEPRRMTLDLEFMPEFEADRKELTCMFCRLRNCDHTVTLRGHGTTVSGLHLKCLEAHEAVVSRLKSSNLL